MKFYLLQKNLSFLGMFCFVTIFAQSNFPLPANTVMYMEMNGKQLNSKVNWAKFNPIFAEVFKKNAKKNTIWTDFSKTGIKYDETQTHYLVMNDSVKSYNVHFKIEDQKKLEDFINSAKKEGVEINRKNKYSYVNLNDNTFIAWNKKEAVLKILSYTKPFQYSEANAEVEEIEAIAIDAADDTVESVAVVEAEEAEVFNYKDEIRYLEEDLLSYKESIKSSQAEIAQIKKTIQYLKKHHQYPVSKDTAPEIDEERVADTAEESPAAEATWDDAEYKERMDSLAREEFVILKSLSVQFFDEFYDSTLVLEIPAGKTKFKDPKADLFAYSNFGSFLHSTPALLTGQFSYLSKVLGELYDANTAYNLYFQKDAVKIVTNYQHQNPKFQKSMESFYKIKTNRKLSKLVTDKSLGYMAVNLNAYKGFNALYDIAGQLTKDQEYQQEIGLLIETMKIVLDEKAITKIAPGNAIFVLNDIGRKKVEYTDYDYDDDYNEKEVTKMKEISVPNFTFAFITENESYWKRIFEALCSNKNTAEKFINKGSHYEFVDKKGSEIEKLMFSVNKGIVYLSTSLEYLDPVPQSAITKKSARGASRHAMYGWLHGEKLMQGLQSEFTSKQSQEMFRLLKDNMGELSYQTDVTKGSIQSEITYKINNSSENSLMYFFDLFDGIRKIMEPKIEPKKL